MGRAGNTNVPHPRGTGVPGFFHGKGWKINVELVSIPDACVQAATGPPETGGNPRESKPQVGTTRQQDTNRRDQQRNLGTSTTPARPNPGGVQDTEMGPCRKHLDSVLRQLQTEIFRGSQTLYVPNCDHRGFYRKRQCRSSQGQRRGPCWCVDRMGQPLPASADSNGGSPCSAGSSG
ncbi:Insulin-like growth factor-binding protein 6 [Myotis davidii]|uniref:Insulin-like growth factor-binding protein 6 n=1 Tax=Myotis davidii TaxID=225400 RepID=L5M9J4_MYODS|nr:Insulin-like growth factor-binding protein 6 [Myotis davidii]